MSTEHIEEARGLVEEAKRIAGFPALLHRFIDTAAEAIVIVDKEGLIVLFNRRASFLFGWTSEEVLGQPIEILIPDELRERHAAVHRAGFITEPYTRPMGANADLRARHKDGSNFSVLIDLHPEMGADGIYVRAAIRRKADSSAPPTIDLPSKCPWVPTVE
jgi:PAS domain S-box-containing protein